MRLALYTLIFLGTVLLVLDLSKLVKNIEPPKKAEAPKQTPVETHGSQENPKSAKNPHGHPEGHPDIEQALALYTAAIEKAPDQAKPYVDRANAYIANQDYSKAIADYDQAIKLEPANAEHILQRGALYLSSGKSDQAVADFDRALEIDPELTKALAYRAYIHYRNGKHQQALDDCLRMLKNDPTFTDLHTTIAQCYKTLKQDDKALEHIQLYIETTKDAAGKKEAEALLKQWTEQPSE